MNLCEFLKKIDLTNEEYLIIGVSAGPDSMALLHMLKNSTDKKIVCAHINHNVRIESINEEKYLKQYCLDNDIIFEPYLIDSYHENNFENEARKKRYAFYEQLLKKYHSKYLFLAHHGDDLIETILMKIARGTDLEGYAGIKEISKQKDYYIVRPLLALTKNDLIKYNEDNNITYYIDSSNNNDSYTRNRYRINIIPALKKEDKNIHLKYLKYSNNIQEALNYINKSVDIAIKDIYKDSKIYIDALKKEDIFLQKNIIYRILKDIYNNKDNIIKEKHIKSILSLVESNKPNLTINLPNNYIAKKTYHYIIIKEKEIIDNNDYDIIIESLNNTFKIKDIIIKIISEIDNDSNSICRLNSKNIKLPLHIRNRRNGDFIEVMGLNGKKKIKDIFIDSKIPKEMRNTYPLITDNNDNILWIPNIKKSKYNVKKNEFCDIILTSYKEGDRNEKEEK